MAEEAPVNMDRLPTLTEVLELGREGGAPADHAQQASPGVELILEHLASPDAGRMASPVLDGPSVVQQVLAQLEPRLGTALDARLRESLAPVLARTADTLIRELREELAQTLRGLVEEAVAQAQRQGKRS